MTTDKDWPDCDDTVSAPRPKGPTIHETLIRSGKCELTLDMPEVQEIARALIVDAIKSIVKGDQ
jgi:hypothetical protein